MGKQVVAIIAFAAAFFAIQHLIGSYKEKSAVDTINTEIEALREDVRKNNPDEPEALAVKKAAIKKAEENINSKSTQKEKLETAAGTFLGFYLVNTRQRAEYCQNLGVDISSFTDAFKKSHQNEYNIAVTAISAAPAEIDELYGILKSQFVTVVEQDMDFIASENGVSLDAACRLVSDNADTIVPEMHVSIVQPAVYNTLVPAN